MIHAYLSQIKNQVKQQPVISVVGVVATSLSIFLIMLVVMMQQVKVAPFAPESNRNRFLHVDYISVVRGKWSGNGPMSVLTAKACFTPLNTPQAVTVYTTMVTPASVSLPKQPVFSIDLMQTDDVFWRVFDFTFVAGVPYDKAMFDAGMSMAVLSESVAKKIFQQVNVIGREFLLNHAPYRVVGVVKDVSTLATSAYGQVWIPYTSTGIANHAWGERLMGEMSCTILARSREDFPIIRKEVEQRRQAFNKVLQQEQAELIFNGCPYDQATNAIVYSSGKEPDLNRSYLLRFMVYAILLLVPAINLGGMTQSRLRQRISEIGIRRAFGATRLEVMVKIVAENLLMTLLAGFLGLGMSVLFAYCFDTFLFTQEFSQTLAPPSVDVTILLHTSTFVYALLFCFVFNLLSSAIPAWRASRMGIVNALSGKLTH